MTSRLPHDRRHALKVTNLTIPGRMQFDTLFMEPDGVEAPGEVAAGPPPHRTHPGDYGADSEQESIMYGTNATLLTSVVSDANECDAMNDPREPKVMTAPANAG